jgi:hypothetical protein
MAPHYQEGVYDNVEIVGQGFTRSKQKGTPGFYLEINPGGDYARKLEWWLPGDREDAVDRLLEDLTSLGLPIDKLSSFSQLNPGDPLHVSFVGITVSVKCRHEGQYERWSTLRASKPKEVAPPDPSAIRQLDALFGKKLKGKTVQPTTPKGKPLSADAGKDDPSGIPF